MVTLIDICSGTFHGNVLCSLFPDRTGPVLFICGGIGRVRGSNPCRIGWRLALSPQLCHPCDKITGRTTSFWIKWEKIIQGRKGRCLLNVSLTRPTQTVPSMILVLLLGLGRIQNMDGVHGPPHGPGTLITNLCS